MRRELSICVRDPIIARDGRPFTQGGRMKPLAWPYPSTVAGAMRTILGKLEGKNFPPATVAVLKEVEVGGPIASRSDSLYFAAPKDAVLRESDQQLFCARPTPFRLGEGSDLPSGQPVCLPDFLDQEFKPGKLAPFWSQEAMIRWLLSPLGQGFQAPNDSEVLSSPEIDYRTHLSIDPVRGTAEESMLFETAGLALPGNVELSVRIRAGYMDRLLEGRLPLSHPLGGERRLVRWKQNDKELWTCPPNILSLVAKARRFRLVLATPALFRSGWLPRWAANGHIPGTNIRVELKGAIVERWKPVSGWSLERGRFGPKPVRRMVPAGSVYFFERPDPNDSTALPLEELWLGSVSDESADRRDGFGLALWGLWD